MPISESNKTFKAACDELGLYLSNHGFKYIKSKKQATSKRNYFEYSINFSSSRSTNSVPGHIRLEIFATVHSPEFGDFRRNKGISLPTNENCLIAIQLENIFKEAPPYIRYNIGGSEDRPIIINNIKSVLETEVLPFFNLIESPKDLKSYLVNNHIPCLDNQILINDYYEYTNIKYA